MKNIAIFIIALLAGYMTANAQLKYRGTNRYNDKDSITCLPIQTIKCGKDKIIDAFAYVYYRYHRPSNKYAKLCMNILLWPQSSGNREQCEISCSGNFKRQNSVVLHAVKCPADGGGYVFEGEADVFTTAALKGENTSDVMGKLKYKVTFNPDDKNACKAKYEIVKTVWAPSDEEKGEEETRYGFHTSDDSIVISRNDGNITLQTYNSGNDDNPYISQINFKFMGSAKESSVPGEFVMCDSIYAFGSLHNSGSYFAADRNAFRLYKCNSPNFVYQVRLPLDYSKLERSLKESGESMKKAKRIENGSIETRATCKVGFVNNDIFIERASLSTLLHY